MSDYLTRYVPEFDEDEARLELAGFSREQLLDMLVMAYKFRRVMSKQMEELEQKLKRISAIVDEPSSLLSMPGVPSADELRRKFDEEE